MDNFLKILTPGSQERAEHLQKIPHVFEFDATDLTKVQYTLAVVGSLGIALHKHLKHLHPGIGGGKFSEPILNAAMHRAALSNDEKMIDAIVEIVPLATKELATLVVEDFRIYLHEDLESKRKQEQERNEQSQNSR